MSVQPEACRDNGNWAGRALQERHQVHQVGSSTLSAWTPPTQQAETHRGTSAVPGKEALSGGGWQLPSAPQQMLKPVRSPQTAAMPALQQSLQHGEGQTGPKLCQHHCGAKQLPVSQPDIPEQHHEARDLSNTNRQWMPCTCLHRK